MGDNKESTPRRRPVKQRRDLDDGEPPTAPGGECITEDKSISNQGNGSESSDPGASSIRDLHSVAASKADPTQGSGRGLDSSIPHPGGKDDGAQKLGDSQLRISERSSGPVEGMYVNRGTCGAGGNGKRVVEGSTGLGSGNVRRQDNGKDSRGERDERNRGGGGGCDGSRVVGGVGSGRGRGGARWGGPDGSDNGSRSRTRAGHVEVPRNRDSADLHKDSTYAERCTHRDEKFSRAGAWKSLDAQDFQYLRVSDGIVGTCMEVERSYIRVQSQPNPGTVRPAAVLQKSLEAVARREAAGEPYHVTHDFYMSICQDLRLQQIETELTVAARENFALCAMRARVGPSGEGKGMDIQVLGDCLLHLHALYEKNPGQLRQLEFSVYRFLMWLGFLSNGANDASAQLNSSLKALLVHAPHAAVKHATDVMSAVVTGDARHYFALVASPPGSTREQDHIHETLLAPAVRSRAYETLLKAYKFVIPLASIGELLGFHGNELSDYLAQQRAVFDAATLDVDASKNEEKREK